MTTQTDLAVTQLTNKILQVFSVNTNGSVFTTWQATSAPDGPWVPWARFPGRFSVIKTGYLGDRRPFLLGITPDGVLLSNMKVSTAASDAWSGWNVFPAAPKVIDAAVVTLNGGAPQIFVVAADNSVQTCWDALDANEPDWQPWQAFPGQLKKITASNLSDGRPQLFGIALDGTLVTAFKVSTDTGAAWSDWGQIGDKQYKDVSTVRLPGGALQIFAVHPFGTVYTCWKASNHPDAAWTAWEAMPQRLNGIATGVLSDGRAELFGIWTDGSLSTSKKETTSPAAAWSVWTPFDPGAAPPAPINCRVNLESIRILNTRSRHEDTVFVSVSLAIGPYAPQAKSQAMGNLNNGLFPVNLSFDNIQMSDTDTAVLTFTVVNNGHSDPGVVIKQLEDATKQLAQKGADAIATAAAGTLGAALGASLGTAAVPIVGTALGALAGWIVDSVGTALFANCDGSVAAGVHAMTGAQLRDAGFLRQEEYNPGTDSPGGCGSNSEYFVTWTVAVA